MSEQKPPTPLDAWIKGGYMRFVEIEGDGNEYHVTLSDYKEGVYVGPIAAPTLDAAILAALEQAKGDPE
jgi:hypothetical protein